MKHPEPPEIEFVNQGTPLEPCVVVANWAEIDSWARANIPGLKAIRQAAAGNVPTEEVPKLLAAEMLRVYCGLLKEHVEYVMRGVPK